VYLIQHNAVDTNASVNVTDWFSVGGALEYFTPELADGTDRPFRPSTSFFQTRRLRVSTISPTIFAPARAPLSTTPIATTERSSAGVIRCRSTITRIAI
jgi:hypothetical protein